MSCKIKQIFVFLRIISNNYLDDCDESTESIFIEYLDANNLCEYCMSQSLLYGEFNWVDNFDETKPFDYD